MPVALGYLLFAGPLGGIFSFGSLVAASQVALGIGLSVLSTVAQRLFQKKPETPKPEDGKYNLRQNVPSGVVILGRVKKGSDYLALEEKGGVAYHLLCPAMHRIEGFVSHYLHDEAVTLNGSGVVTAPAHFGSNVTIKTRLGLDAETAYSELSAAMPTIFGADHRGDGLASVMVSCASVAADVYQTVYPQQMPVHSAVIDGALLYDPRDETTAFSTNLALMRLFHLTHASGLKLSLDDLHLPDWENAADVCDEDVTNRQDETESRYHGGLWYRFENSPVDVGRTIDQAAELVLYETAEGKVGVHAGAFVTPDVRLTEDDIYSVVFDANRRKASNVIAVRGRYTDPDKLYNTVDAAIVGDPYPGDDSERTKTVDNVAVQSHNHIQRLQTLAKIRANAPRVRVLCDYEPAKLVPYRRFVKVHYPPKLDEAIVEITGRPKLSLRNLTYEFEGIVVPATLYAFVAATDEGEPPATILELTKDGIPVPEGFDVTIETETLVGGGSAAYGLATWDAQSTALTVEVEWQPTAGGPTQSVQTTAGQTEIRTGYLADGTEYRFRARNWSGGVPSEWTDYVTDTPVTDTVAPQALGAFSVTGGPGPFLGNVPLSFTTAAGDTHLSRIALYRVPYGDTLDTDTHFFARIAAVPGVTFAYVIGDTSPTNAVANGSFAADTDWSKGTGWTIGSGVATGAAGAISFLSQNEPLDDGDWWRTAFDVTAISAGAVAVRIGSSGPTVTGTSRTTTGTFIERLQLPTGLTGSEFIAFRKDASFVGSIDNAYFYKETAGATDGGDWDWYAIPENGSGVEGPATSAQRAIVV